jgi:lipoate-protein ligase A
MPNMFKVLKISRKKTREKGFSDPQDRMTNIRRELGEHTDIGKLKGLLVKGFEDRLRVAITPGALNEKERGLIDDLREKYSSAEWIYRR